jgi:hypothetical protein
LVQIGQEILDRNVPRPALGGIGGVKGHNMKEISLPGSPALWAGSFTYLFFEYKIQKKNLYQQLADG